MYTDSETTILAWVVGSYFLLLTIFAYIVNRRVKTYEDYSVAGRTVGTFPLIFTLMGTAIGGSILLGFMTNGYVLGLSQVWLALAATPTMLIVILAMSKPIRRLGTKHRMITMGDFTSMMYGEGARIPTVLSVLLAYCAITGMQFVAIATILFLTVDIPMTAGILIAGGMLTVKTVLGGLKSVVLQDAVHGTIQTVGIFVLFFVTIVVAGGWQTIEENAAAAGEQQMLDVFGIPASEVAVYLLTIGGYQIVRQDLWQRIWAARTMAIVKRGLWVALVLQSIVAVVVVVVGVIGQFGLNLDLPDPSQAYYAIVGSVFPFPLVIVMLIAVLATVISTCDSFFLAGSSSIVNDIVKPRLANPSSKTLLTWSKISVLIIAVIATAMALYIPQLVVLWVLGTAMLVSGILAPVLIGLFWSKVTRSAGVAAMWAGLGSAVTWQLAGEPLGWHPVFIGLPLSIIVLVVGSLLTQSTNNRTQSWAAESRENARGRQGQGAGERLEVETDGEIPRGMH